MPLNEETPPSAEEQAFWTDLEFRVSRAMATLASCRAKGMWCDGFIAEEYRLDLEPPVIAGRVWIGFGSSQDDWWFRLELAGPVAGRSRIPWHELQPDGNTEDWLQIDDGARCLWIGPCGRRC